MGARSKDRPAQALTYTGFGDKSVRNAPSPPATRRALSASIASRAEDVVYNLYQSRYIVGRRYFISNVLDILVLS